MAGYIRCRIHPAVPHVSQRIVRPSIKRGNIAGATYCATSVSDNLIILGIPLVNILRHFQRGCCSGDVTGEQHQLPLLSRAGADRRFPADVGVVTGTLGGEVEVVVLQLDLVDVAGRIHGSQSDAGIRIIPSLGIDVAVARIAFTGGPVVVQSVVRAQSAHDLVTGAKSLDVPALGVARALGPQANVPVIGHLLVPIHIQAFACAGMGNHVVRNVSRKCHDNTSFQFVNFERVQSIRNIPIGKCKQAKNLRQRIAAD